MRVARCKGTRDLLPVDMARFRHIEGVFRDTCLGWGYQEVRTPTLEYLYLFTAAGTLTPDMLGRVYSFLDWDGWSGERVVLRPEGTIPTARLYVEHLQDRPPARLFYVQNVFAFEGTGTETRERWQCGAELIGEGRPEADVELVSLALEVLGALGVGPVEVRVSHAGLIKALLNGLGPGEVPPGALDRAFAGDLESLALLTRGKPDLERALRLVFSLKGTSATLVRNMSGVLPRSMPGVEASLQDVVRVSDLLTDVGCSYELDFASGRDFEYYTGAIFQFFCGGRKVGGGGRYDELIPLVGGGNVPASGFALYVDRLMELRSGEDASRPLVLVTCTGDTGRELRYALEAARSLRRQGYAAQLGLEASEPGDLLGAVAVSVQDGAPSYEVTGRAGQRVGRASSPEEVVRLVKGAACP